MARTAHPGAEAWVPDTSDLGAMARAAAGCEGCDLHRGATQVVFSAGGRRARIALVGEQPGDREDREGVPFVGPAGRLLDDALEAAGIDRSAAYLTNAVTHFVLTTHPSAVVRRRRSEDFDEAFGGLVADLRTAAEVG